MGKLVILNHLICGSRRFVLFMKIHNFNCKILGLFSRPLVGIGDNFFMHVGYFCALTDIFFTSIH